MDSNDKDTNNNDNNNSDNFDDKGDNPNNSIDGGDFKGKLLHLSCLWNNFELLNDLLLGDEIEHINSQDLKGRTPLHEAIISDSLQCARLLLMNGANPNIKSPLTKCCLHLAIEKRNIEMIRLLIEFNANIFLHDDYDGLMAIDFARKLFNDDDDDEIIRELQSKIEEYSMNLYKTLTICVHKGDTNEMIRILEETELTKSDNDRKYLHSIINYTSNNSNTLLFKACQDGHLNLVEKLLEFGADDRINALTRYSPLYIAAYNGRKEICRLLLQKFPNLVQVYTIEHWLPIHAASINNHLDIVRLLIEYDYPHRLLRPFIKSDDHHHHHPHNSMTPNHTSNIRNSQQSLKSLSKNSNDNSNTSNDNCDDQSQQRQKFVYFAPFDLNAQDIAGQTILYMATLSGNFELIEYLLNLRVNSYVYTDEIANLLNEAVSEDHFEDCLSQNNVDSDTDDDDEDSSPDITVISTLNVGDKSSHKSNNENPVNTHNQGDSLRNLIENLKSSQISIKSNNQNHRICRINPIKIDLYCNCGQQTSLHSAVQKKYYSIASLLLENGANPNNLINGMPPAASTTSTPTASSPSTLVTRVSHFNQSNLMFDPKLSMLESLKDLKSINSNPSNADNLNNQQSATYHSTALREAIRNRDRAMVDLLLRFGATDDLCDQSQSQTSNSNDEDEESIEPPIDDHTMTALEISLKNNDNYFISKLLSLKAYQDYECKINRKSFDGSSLIQMNRNNNNAMNNLTLSSIFPTNPVMIDWHSLRIRNINAYRKLINENLHKWLIDSALLYNIKLKLNNTQNNADSLVWNTALAAITRVDLSENNLQSVPITLFTDLPSLKILNLSKNRLQTLPEIKTCSYDDNSFRINNEDDQSTRSSKNFLSRMRKSHSVTASLSTCSTSSNQKSMKYPPATTIRNKTLSTESIETLWNLPYLEELYLQDNQLECLPLSLFQQPELRILDCSNNKLRTLPPMFWFCPKLSELNLSMNLLCDLSSPISYLLSFIIHSDKGQMSKSISTSSIASSSNLSSSLTLSDLNKFDSNNVSAVNLIQSEGQGSTTPAPTTTIKTNLIPFELNILKPWSNNLLTVKNDVLAEPFVNGPEQSLLFNTQNTQTNEQSLSSMNHDFESLKSLNNYHPHRLSKDYNPLHHQHQPQQQISPRHLQCSIQQLNLSHNGFDHIPPLLSCLAQKLTHLNLSYNRLTTVFDSNLVLGHLPKSLKHLDLSNNQIDQWYCIDDYNCSTNRNSTNIDYDYYDQLSNDDYHMVNDHQPNSSSSYCFHDYLRRLSNNSCDFRSPLNGCPLRQHTKLDNLKTLILSNNNLKELIITRDELLELIDSRYTNRSNIANNMTSNDSSDQAPNTGSKLMTNIFSFNLSSSFGGSGNSGNSVKNQQDPRVDADHPPTQLKSSHLAQITRLLSSSSNLTDSQDDLTRGQNADEININFKTTKYTKLFFPNLSMLNVSRNHIGKIPKSISYLKQLSVLNLSENIELQTLPPEMGLLTKLWNLNTRGCLNIEEPIRSMILDQNKTYKTCDIISYLNSILENSKPYKRLKLMLVGYQNIGKTSLLEALRQEGSTYSASRKSRSQQQQQYQHHDHWSKRINSPSGNMATNHNNYKTSKCSTLLSTVGVDLCEWVYEKKVLKNNHSSSGAIRDRSLSRTRIAAQQQQQGQNLNRNLFGSVANNPNNIGPITFRTWDFGGQREYYATHQYFLSKRSIYLVLWKITDGEKGIQGLHQWLVNIQMRAPNSPVIIVGTHYDLVKEFYPPFYSNELQNLIREKYMKDQIDSDKRGLPKIVASIEISTKTKHNIRLLANLIYDTACEMRSSGTGSCVSLGNCGIIGGGKDRLLEQKIPATYLALEEIVNILSMERKMDHLEPVLTTEQYRQQVTRLMAEQFDMSFRDYNELNCATKFLHENGVMLHYEDTNLKDLYFLDPQWLCDILAHVVTIREINPFVRNGLMKIENLSQLFKNTLHKPMDLQNYILNLLNKFELAITWDNRTILIPSLLPTEEQLRTISGSNIVIPLRSRLKIHHHSSSLMNKMNNLNPEFVFENELKFYEFTADSYKTNGPNSPGDKSTEDPTNQRPSCTVTAKECHHKSIYRLLILSYIPCGFWSRLIARVLADEQIIDIVRSYYQLPSYTHNDPILIDFLNNIKAQWYCWQTGFGLRYLDTFLLRVKEYSLINNNLGSNNVIDTMIMKSLNRSNNNNNPSYPFDYNCIKFYIRQRKDSFNTIGENDRKSSSIEWCEIDINQSNQSSSLIEIYLPNQSLCVDTTRCLIDDNGNGKMIENKYILEPNIEMLTKLLVIVVEHIDTLLEDWYPSLGTRFIHTSDGRFLITRLVPCTQCLHSILVQQQQQQKQGSSLNEGGGNDMTKNHLSPENNEILLSPDTSDVDTNLVDFYKMEVKKATLQDTTSVQNDNSSLSMNDPKSTTINRQSTLKRPFIRVNSFMVEECILSLYDQTTTLECCKHGRIRMDSVAPDFIFLDLKDNYRIDRNQLKLGKLLGRGSFGFVFRAYYRPSRHSLPSTSSNDHLTSGHLTNSKFYLQQSRLYSSDNDQSLINNEKNYEVALKLLQPINDLEFNNQIGGNNYKPTTSSSSISSIRKADMDAYEAMQTKWNRDPLQYSCKAYCTARTELNILLNLKHSNIASILGICPRPLALILTLAPFGSLDVHVKQYRRHGQRIAINVLQKTFLQISKALEYLHQQHIIYRDLKSENVLVWAFPAPYSSSTVNNRNSNHNSNDNVHLKLADYGISRSSLPTGTKGFGGTEGFMAPEIMLYNGEEEYTEKVDCFSFAMFMYELSTLHFPFEGQEFAIRENILDGIRPSLSQNDLDYLPESFIDLMTRSWAHEPNERPNMSQIVSIISAPEFCSLRDVATLSDNSSLICATSFQKFDSSEFTGNNNPMNNRRKHGLFLSKIGKQIDLLEIDGSRWNPSGQRLECENLNRRTITSSCVVNGNQLWLGDSNACLNIYCFNSNSNTTNHCNINDNDQGLSSSATSLLINDDHPMMNQDLFILLCTIKMEFTGHNNSNDFNINPSTMIAIKSICWLETIQSIIVLSNNGYVWLINYRNLMNRFELSATSDNRDASADSLLKSNELDMIKLIDNNNIPTFCIGNLAIESSNKTIDIDDIDQSNSLYYDLWFGQIEGQIIILTIKSTTMEVVRQRTIDHYCDRQFNQFNTPIAERNDVYLLIGANNHGDHRRSSSIFSVLYSGYIIYQWDVRHKQISHKLDCSKLAPCSESLMSISIEDHLKPGNCRISEVAINDMNNEIYIGTNFGCIIVAELKSLKPITVFRPYQREVKFIITLDNYGHKLYSMINDDDNDGNTDSNEQQQQSKMKSSISSSIKSIWPFNHQKSNRSAVITHHPADQSDSIKSKRRSPMSKNGKTIQPFVTIGRGYRNLLDRFTNANTALDSKSHNLSNNNNTQSNESNIKNVKLKQASQFYAIIWDSGYWEF